MRRSRIRSIVFFFAALLSIASTSAWSAPAAPATAELTHNNEPVVGQYSISGAYTLTWSAVSSINFYWIFESTNSGATWTSIAVPTSTAARSISFTGKAVGRYDYQIYACTSSPSACSTAKQVYIEVKAYPSNLTNFRITTANNSYVGSNGKGTISLAWNASTNAPVYQIMRSSNGSINAATDTLVGWTDATSYSLTSVDPNLYYYYARACAGWLGSCSNNSAVSGVNLLPLPPTNLSIEGLTDNITGTYKLKWSAPAGNFLGYYITESVNGGAYGNSVWVNATDPLEKLFSGKAPGTYRYKISTSAGFLTFSAEQQFADMIVYPAPGAVSNLRITSTSPNVTASNGLGSINLAWNAGANAGGYLVSRSPQAISGGSTALVWLNANTTSFTDTGLQPGSYNYYITPCRRYENNAVYGCNWDTTSSAVNTVLQLGNPATATATERLDTVYGLVKLDWTPITGAAGYYISRTVGSTSSWISNGYFGPGTLNTLNIVEDTTGSPVTYNIYACWAASNPLSCGPAKTATITVPNAPMAPRDLKAANIKATTDGLNVIFNWQAPAMNASERQLTYLVSSQQGTNPSEFIGITTSNSIKVRRELGGYNFWITACNGNRCGVSSTSLTGLVLPVPNQIKNFRVDNGGNAASRSITLRWDKGEGIGYYVSNKYGNTTELTALDVNTTSLALTNQSLGDHQYAINACNAYLGPCGMATSIPYRVRLTPSSFALTATPSGTTVNLSWPQVTGATGYYVTEAVSGGDTKLINNYYTTTSASLTSRSLTTYQYTVRPCINYGIDCDTAAAASATLTDSAAAIPGGTITLTAPSTTSTNSAALSWSGATGTIGNYEIEFLLGDGAWSVWDKVTTTNHTATGLLNGQYQFHVRACNSKGCTAWSNTSTVTVTLATAKSASASAASEPTLPSTSSSDVIGAVGGNAHVTEQGTFTYSIPIGAVSGTAGVTPKIALSYSSTGGNGPLGLGWSIQGLSAISRCGRTLVQDWEARPVSFDDNDRLCIDGKRLVPADGNYANYWANGKELRVQVNGFSKIFVRDHSDGYVYFEMEAKDGSRTYFGTDEKALSPNHAIADSRIGSCTGESCDDHTKIFMWSIKKFVDSAGNPIVFDYINIFGSIAIADIRYAYGDTSTNNARLHFEYDVSRPDTSLIYFKGGALSQILRLQRVDSYNNYDASEQLVRSWYLKYKDPEVNYNISRLTEIKECVGAITDNYTSATSCQKPTTFVWSGSNIGFSSKREFIDQISTEIKISGKVGDFNGDGKQDLVHVGADVQRDDADMYWGVSLSDGTTLAPSQGMGRADKGGAPTWDVIDYNQDGYSDVIRVVGSEWKVYLSTGASGQLSTTPMSIGVPHEDAYKYTDFTDINGDGMPDMVVKHYVADPYNSGFGASFAVRYMERYLENGVYKYRFQTTATALNIGLKAKYPTSVQATVINGTEGCPSGSGVLCWNRSELPVFADFNGDRLPDLLVCMWDRYIVFANKGAGKFEFLMEYQQSQRVQNETGFQPIDLNGDGLSDLITYRATKWVGTWGSAGSASIDVFMNNGSTLVRTQTLAEPDPLTNYVRANDPTYFPMAENELNSEFMTLFDFNGDGYQDLLTVRKTGATTLSTRLFNPTTFTFEANANKVIDSGIKFYSLENDNFISMDIDGDSKADMVRFYTDDVGQNEGGMADLQVCLAAAPFQPNNVITSVNNGLGNTTTISYESLGKSTVYDATDFIDANNQNWNEASRNEIVTTAGSNPVQKFYPVFDIRKPGGYAVRTLTSTATATETASIDYKYYGLKAAGMGMGQLGYRRVESIDRQSGMRTRTTYRQDWPFIGMPSETTVELPLNANNYRLISKKTTASGLYNYATGGAIPTLLALETPILTEYRYDPDQSVETQLKKSIVNTTIDEWGNTKQLTTITYNGANGEVARVTTDNKYGEETTLTSAVKSWYKEKGRLTESIVTHARNGETSIIRKSRFTYCFNDATCMKTDGESPNYSGNLNGLIQSEMVYKQSGDTTPFITTSYRYDKYGNGYQVKMSGAVDAAGALQNRTVTTAFDAAGRFPTQTINDKGVVVEEILSRNKYGQPTQIKTEGYVTTNIKYGLLGREVQRWNSTGAWTRQLYSLTHAQCPAETTYAVQDTAGGQGSTVGCFDALGRVIRAAKEGFDGSWIYKDSVFDKAGRTTAVSDPYLAGTSAYFTATGYDALNRVRDITLPDNTYTSLQYSGLTTSTVNPKGQYTSTTVNPMGEPTSIVDTYQGRVEYSYYADGTLKNTKTVSSDFGGGLASGLSSNSVTTYLTYDTLGRKVAMNDPDKGNWTYAYNAFGELITQTNANNQKTVMAYDSLGRMTSRKDVKAGGNETMTADWLSKTDWYYDNELGVSKPNRLLRLEHSQSEAGVTTSTLRRLFNYDTQGRTVGEQITADGGATNGVDVARTVEFDEYGRTRADYDATDSNSGILYTYNTRGYPTGLYESAILTGSGTARPYVEFKGQTPRGQLTSALVGGKFSLSRYYDPITGRLDHMGAGEVFSDTLQYIDYDYDITGLMTRREKRFGGNTLVDSYQYDELNRLTQTTTTVGANTVTQTLNYDSFGNIKYKSDMGNYTYTDAKPHAVRKVDVWDYAYDNNGNLTSGRSGNLTLLHTAFDKPYQIMQVSSSGANTIEFAYGEDRQRFKRVDNHLNKTTYYLGNVEVRVTKNSGGTITRKETKRFIGNVAVVTNIYDGAANNFRRLSTTTDYLITDQQGSLDVVVSDEGVIKYQSGFDAWGMRREVNTGGALSTASLTNLLATTNKGYTGHETLDDVGLIHMNGRAYDPKLARFVEADSILQASDDLQSYNRYAYVRNTPVNGTDPDGHWWEILAIAAAVYGVQDYVTYHDGPQWVADVAVIGGCIYGASIGMGPATCGAATASQSYAANQDFGAAFQAGVMAFNQAALSEGIGKAFGAEGQFARSTFKSAWQYKAAHAVAHGLSGGVFSVLQNGKFGHGFVSAGVSTYVGHELFATIDNHEWYAVTGRTAVAAVVGGTMTDITGGKFANGARTAAFAWLFNAERETLRKTAMSITDASKEIFSRLQGVDPDTYGNLDPSITNLPWPRGKASTVGNWVNINAKEFGFTLDEEELMRLISAVSHESQHTGQTFIEQMEMEPLRDDNYSPDNKHWQIEDKSWGDAGKLYPDLKKEWFPR